ncbi:MAG TPA: hypothetical protein VEZ90_04165 [Blastocatellia bacterium]|nr:hypothetical protein [Blastocatellia bacterium]
MQTRKKPADQEVDPLLAPYLAEVDEERAGAIVSRLIADSAQPVIDRVIKSTLRAAPEVRSDRQDVNSEIVVRLVEALKEFRTNPRAGHLKNFLGYVAVVAYNSCYSYLRTTHPLRRRLKNQISYAVSHTETLALWKSRDGCWLCGFDQWRTLAGKCPQDRLAILLTNPDLLGAEVHREPRWKPLELLPAIFRFTKSPVDLDDLVDTVAGLLQITDHESVGAIEAAPECDLFETLASEHKLQSDVMESTVSVKVLWNEICTLPRNQATALLLGLRDKQGLDAISLLGNAGVASIRQVAEVLGFEAAELAGIWDQLPMDDLRIAGRLGITRQQVINLRKSARKRLTNRLREYRDTVR